MRLVRRGQGRPALEQKKTWRFCIRFDEEDRRKLAFLKYKTGLNYAEIIRKGIEMQYQIAKIGD